MTGPSPRTPSDRRHKPSGQAVIALDSRDIDLGRYDTPKSGAESDRLIGEWLAYGRRLAGPAADHDPSEEGAIRPIGAKKFRRAIIEKDSSDQSA